MIKNKPWEGPQWLLQQQKIRELIDVNLSKSYDYEEGMQIALDRLLFALKLDWGNENL